ncbi:hypothetical protein [uncultured Erythrobacter sp.]|uniref:hypothetical protein n=1 Tax=uncultured Erythrobacter sp. TaxID=263913 RepID=UPI0026121B81|nr:hypothetical protein [uncultured Erythrobacter sp.]
MQKFDELCLGQFNMMAATSENEANIVTAISEVIEEPIGIYSSTNKDEWLSLSCTQIAAKSGVRFMSIPLDEAASKVIFTVDGNVILQTDEFRLKPMVADNLKGLFFEFVTLVDD